MAAQMPPLAVLQLERRLVPARFYGADATGTWEYVHTLNRFTPLTPSAPSAMTRDGDGMVGVYDHGTWRYQNDQWTQLTAAPSGRATALDAVQVGGGATGTSETVLYGSYPSGVWRWTSGDDRWEKVFDGQARTLEAVGRDRFFGGFNWGTWEWNGGAWTQLTTGVPFALAYEKVTDSLVGSYPWGTYIHDAGGWRLSSTETATDLKEYYSDARTRYSSSVSSGVYGTYADGIWRYDAYELSREVRITNPSNPEVIETTSYPDEWTRVDLHRAQLVAARMFTTFVPTDYTAATFGGATWVMASDSTVGWVKVTDTPAVHLV